MSVVRYVQQNMIIVNFVIIAINKWHLDIVISYPEIITVLVS